MDLSGGGGSSGSGDASKENSSGGICNLSAILSDLSCGDRRAPGCEKKVRYQLTWWHGKISSPDINYLTTWKYFFSWYNLILWHGKSSSPISRASCRDLEYRWLRSQLQQTTSRSGWWPPRRCTTRWALLIFLWFPWYLTRNIINEIR